MSERARITAQKTEAKKENSISRIKKADSSQSLRSPIDHILSLQRTIGNQAVQRLFKSGMIQAKLTIGQPNDIYEQEADRVADEVMRMPEPGVQRQVEPEEEEETLQPKPLANQITPLVQVQRQEEPEEEEEELQAKPLTEQITPLVQRQVEPEEEEEEEAIQTKLADGMQVQRQEEPEEEEEEEPIQTKQVSTHTPAVTPNLASRIQSLRGGGQPLSESTRAFFEPRFGHDFSQVRTHKDSHSSQMNRTLNAKAFTDKKDIYYGTGNYPGNNALTAHELTHVVQQTNGDPLSSKLNRQPKIKAINSRNTVQRANSFQSFGPGVRSTTSGRGIRQITRSKQASPFTGLNCSSTSIMYMIQSYGLVPPNMTRRQFEYAFTPLKPSGMSGYIKVGIRPTRPTGVNPVDLFTKASLQKRKEKRKRRKRRTETDRELVHKRAYYRKTWKKTLLGSGGEFVSKVIKVEMPWILAAFKNQSQKPGYGFMKAYTPVSGGAYAPKTRERWFNCYTQLKKGTILANYANYFQEGNTILAGVNTEFPPRTSLKHWVVIVKDKERITLGGKSYHLYPADDPLGYQIYVMVPWPESPSTRVLRKLFLTIYMNKKPKAYTYNGKIVRRLSIKRSNRKKRVYKRAL